MRRNLVKLQLMNTSILAAILVTCLANTILIFKMQGKPTPSGSGYSRPASMLASNKSQGPVEDGAGYQPDDQVQDLLLNQSLIHFAGSERYSEADENMQMRMLKEWCHDNIPGTLQSFAPERKHDFFESLHEGLDDMLSERDFEHQRA
jgi:hypothetical protein